MSWITIGAGTGIGLVLGGPIGAALGAWVGAVVDTDEDHMIHSCPHCGSDAIVVDGDECHCEECGLKFGCSDGNRNRVVFFAALCSLLAKMAEADGDVSSNQRAVITTFFEKMGLNEEDQSSAWILFDHALESDHSIDEYARQYAEIGDPKVVDTLYTILWQVACADGVLDPREDKALKNVVVSLGLPVERYHECKKLALEEVIVEHSLDMDECYKLAGSCDISTSNGDRE